MRTTRRPFASIVQAVLVALLLVSILLIAQQFSVTLYRVGLIMLATTTLVQIAFGNIPPTANLRQSLRLWLLFSLIIAVVFGLGIAIAPFLVALGRG